MVATRFQDQLECTPGKGCQVGAAVIQVADTVYGHEKDIERHEELVTLLFAEIKGLRNWIMGTLFSVIMVGGGAILTFILTRLR